MKPVTNVLKSFTALTLITLLASLSALASNEGGHGGGNGGDPNERRFKEIATDLSDWIISGGSAELKLPSAITHEVYKSKMLKYLNPGVTPVAFTDKIILVQSVEKACKNYFKRMNPKSTPAKYAPRIICNNKRFEETSEHEKYRLVHHEYAGLAGFETTKNASSDYEISNQITDYLVETTVLKLAVKGNVLKSIRILPGDYATGDTTNLSLACMITITQSPDLKTLQVSLQTNPNYRDKYYCVNADHGEFTLESNDTYINRYMNMKMTILSDRSFAFGKRDILYVPFYPIEN